MVGVTGLRPVTARAQSVGELRNEIAALEGAPEAGVPRGTLEGIAYMLDVSERIERTFPERAVDWRARADAYLGEVRAGRDPYRTIAAGAITNRGYGSPVSTVRQGYAIYVPPGYDPSRRYPLMVMLHGGSSNGNLFLGVVLGNNMDWLTYDEHLWDEYEPRWSPEWIVVAPDGFGQVLWRWMGERDVLDVIDDVAEHYSVDADRVVLAGLSNGGVGAYAIGARHAWRFSVVQAMAGAPSWLQYTGGVPTPEERLALLTHSGMHLCESTLNTDFRFYHGRNDGGPMRPAYVTEMEEHMRALDLVPNVTWFELGHDLLYPVHRRGRIYDALAPVVRDRRRSEVRLVTGDYRAARQHWLVVSRIDEYPRLSRTVAIASAGDVTIQTERVLELSIDLRDAPVGDGTSLRVVIDGDEAYAGPRAPLGHVAHFAREGGDIGGRWRLGFLPAAAGLEKVPGLSGPLTDPYRDGMVHVYGTLGDAELTARLHHTAERGASGWPLWLWNHEQPVVADVDVTDEMMARSHLVLYGTPGTNAVLERMWSALPITVAADGVHVGADVYADEGAGTRFVYPNPLAPSRYVIVQAGVTMDGVSNGHELPDFLPDWVVYDDHTTRSRPRLIAGRRPGQVAMGYFDRFWRLGPTPTATASSAVPADHPVGRTALGPSPAAEEVLGAGPMLTSASGLVLGGDEGPLDDPFLSLVQDGEGESGVADAGVDGGDGTDAGIVETPEERARRLALNRLLGMPEDFVMSASVLTQTPPPELPHADVVAVPPAPTSFLAPRSDPAGRIARTIARRVPTFPNYRAIIPGGTWIVDDEMVWQIRPEATCLEALDAAGIAHAPPPDDLVHGPTPTPVLLTGAIGGVTYEMLRAEDLLVTSCEMALRMRTLSRVLRRHHVERVVVLSSYRDHPRSSFHTMGLGLDLYELVLDDGTHLSVNDDFVETPAHRTCEAPAPAARAGRVLLEIVCDLVDTHAFSSVLTPNYNDGHRNHVHLDARPDDPRIFVR